MTGNKNNHRLPAGYINSSYTDWKGNTNYDWNRPPSGPVPTAPPSVSIYPVVPPTEPPPVYQETGFVNQDSRNAVTDNPSSNHIIPTIRTTRNTKCCQNRSRLIQITVFVIFVVLASGWGIFTTIKERLGDPAENYEFIEEAYEKGELVISDDENGKSFCLYEDLKVVFDCDDCHVFFENKCTIDDHRIEIRGNEECTVSRFNSRIFKDCLEAELVEYELSNEDTLKIEYKQVKSREQVQVIRDWTDDRNEMSEIGLEYVNFEFKSSDTENSENRENGYVIKVSYKNSF